MYSINKRSIIDLILIVVLTLILLIPGWRLAVASWLQSGLLNTGLLKASPRSIELTLSSSDYQMLLEDVSGKITPLSQWKDQTLFINFWATWCAPCLAEMPGINRLYQDLKSEPEIDFLIISTDESWQEAKDYIDEKGFEFPIYHLSGSIAPTLYSNSIPATYVLTPQGRVVFKHHGMAAYDHPEFMEFLKNMNQASFPDTNR